MREFGHLTILKVRYCYEDFSYGQYIMDMPDVKLRVSDALDSVHPWLEKRALMPVSSLMMLNQ